MLTVNRRHSIHKQFQATRDRQICRAWRVERHDKTGRQHRSARWVLAITGLRKPTCTGRMIKKCSLAVIGKVSAPASRIQVNSISDAVISAKTLLVQASSDTLSDVDRESIASELKGIYETLIGQANATDGNGRYIFGGYKDNAPPFVKSADGSVEYVGDSNGREQRVDASRLMPVTETGVTVFQQVPSGAGYVAEANAANLGSVTFSGPQVVSVNAPDYGDSFRIRFDENDDDEPIYTLQRFDGSD